MKSFGTGINVKLPGVSADRPNIYDFGITYDEMYKDLKAKDPQLYPFVCDIVALSEFSVSGDIFITCLVVPYIGFSFIDCVCCLSYIADYDTNFQCP